MAHHRLDLRPVRAIHGDVPVPGDKSISHRYVMLGSLAQGVTTIEHLAPGADVASTVRCFRGLGVQIEDLGPNAVRIHGRGRAGLHRPSAPLDAGNSGTTMRLIAGVLAGCPFETTVVGDSSLSRRPMRRVIEPLTAMGAAIESQDGRAPLLIRGGTLHPMTWECRVASAQVKSAIMLAGLVPAGTTTVVEPQPTRDHSERAFPTFGLAVRVTPPRPAGLAPLSAEAIHAALTGPIAVAVDGGQEAIAPARALHVPGDPSTAAVWAAAAAALPGSSVELRGVCLNPHRLGFIRALERMGAVITITVDDEIGGESVGRVRVEHGGHRATSIEPAEVPSLIDELPVLAARAALGGYLEVAGAGELRVKESDRITALVTGFRAMGVNAHERPDGFVIDGATPPTGGTADAAGDHRLVMAFTLVALGSTGPSAVTDAGAVAVSYPQFTQDLERLTA
ncbi:MAG: 3-phosphoshikimate 1-carboxyvinyltransferase [Acidobacteria bacterium]|nr:3-phosphoshikimate 1-carboxyvinyltransferase [Acidobacteriota bacterium]